MVIQSALTPQVKTLRRIAAVALLLAGLFSVSLLSGCAGPSYYAQAAAGQIGLMRQREDIDELLEDPDTDPELARSLRLVRDILKFGTDALGLPATGSYTQWVETGRSAVVWNVVAAPEFSLKPKTWCFLVAGCVPYRGYFDQSKAQRFAAKLRSRGYDAIVAPASAYSTLGWLDDPLLDTMLLRGDTALAGVLFHEMAHQALYVKGDTAFNESFASFVEEAAVRRWLAHRGDTDGRAAWQQGRSHFREVDELFGQARAELARLYAAGLQEDTMRSAKARIIDRLCARYARVTSAGEGESGRSVDAPCFINNAAIALRASYRGGSCAFERLFDESGGSMPEFLERSRRIADLPGPDRDQWMRQDCAQVAPEGEL